MQYSVITSLKFQINYSPVQHPVENIRTLSALKFGSTLLLQTAAQRLLYLPTKYGTKQLKKFQILW